MRPAVPKIHIDRRKLFADTGYRPLPHQQAFHDCTRRFKVTFGGERGGKSMTAAHDFLPDLLKPNFWLWILGSQYETIEGVFGWIWDAIYSLVDRGIIEPPLKAVYSKKPARFYLKFPWGAEVDTRTAKNLRAVRSLPVDGMILTEAGDMPEDTWDNYARGRLSDRMGRAVIEGCPVGYNWFVDLGHRGEMGDPDWATFTMSAELTLPQTDLDEKRRTYSEPMYKQKVLGEPVPLSGLVYAPQFDGGRGDGDSVRPWPYRADWLTWAGIDYGYRSPAIVWVQSNGADPTASDFEAYVFDQFVEENVTKERLADALLSRPYEPAGIFGDPSGDAVDNDGWSTFKYVQARCRKAGVVSPVYCTDHRMRYIPWGVDHLRALLQAADGTRRLFLAKHLVDNTVPRGVWRSRCTPTPRRSPISTSRTFR